MLASSPRIVDKQSDIAVAINDTITNGTPTDILYVGAGPVIAQDNNLTWDGTTFTVGGTAKVTTYNVGASGQLNAITATYGVGTAYSLTNSQAAIVFGTTSPIITVPVAGTYLLWGQVNLKYNAATFAGTQTVTLNLRRTNNTAANITNAQIVGTTQIITAQTNTFDVFKIPPVVYTTTNSNDSLTIFADVSTTPGAGSLDAQASGTYILAQRIQ